MNRGQWTRLSDRLRTLTRLRLLFTRFRRANAAFTFGKRNAVPVEAVPRNEPAGHKPKIFIAFANTGGGHLSAARAIEAAIHQRHPDCYETILLNIPLASNSQRVHLLYESYNLMLKADPRYAKHGLRLLNSINVEKTVIPLLPRAYQNIRRVIMREKPDMIVSVHAIVNHCIIRSLKESGWYGHIPYVIVCTDLTDNFLRGWANPDATLAITFTEMARKQMLSYGMPSEKVDVINGFTVNPAFAQQQITRDEARTALGLQHGVFTILVSLGGMAIPQKTKAIVRVLTRSGLPVQLLVVCGMNRTLKREMHYAARRSPVRMHVFGFTQRLPLMMAAADLIIAKPGPGTIMEAVMKELPLLLDNVTEPMPQEVGNLRFALEQGIALAFTQYRSLPHLVETLMRDQHEYAILRDNMRRIKNEDGIFEVAERILAQLPQQDVAPVD